MSKRLDPPSVILTLSCPDGPGIVHAVTGFLAARKMNIMDSAQFGDPTTGTFFMRVHAAEPEAAGGDQPGDLEYSQRRQTFVKDLTVEFEQEFGADREVKVEIHAAEEKPRTLIMVSKIGRQ